MSRARALRVREVPPDGPGLAPCHAIRREVFVGEQGVTEDEEMDDLDAACRHFLAELDGAPVGTARLREKDGVGKAERVAVRAAVRGTGVGAALMDALERAAREAGYREVVLAAQEGAVPFYARLGYVAFGAPFVEARIPHRWMKKALGPPPSA